MPERKNSQPPEIQRTKPERISPGEFKPVIDTILNLDKQMAGQLSIRSGAQTVYFRDVKLSRDRSKYIVYGLHENEGPVRTSFKSDLDFYRDVIENSQTVPEADSYQFSIGMKRVNTKTWIGAFKRAKLRAASLSAQIKRHEPSRMPQRIPGNVIQGISRSLTDLND